MTGYIAFVRVTPVRLLLTSDINFFLFAMRARPESILTASSDLWVVEGLSALRPRQKNISRQYERSPYTVRIFTRPDTVEYIKSSHAARAKSTGYIKRSRTSPVLLTRSYLFSWISVHLKHAILHTARSNTPLRHITVRTHVPSYLPLQCSPCLI